MQNAIRSETCCRKAMTSGLVAAAALLVSAGLASAQSGQEHERGSDGIAPYEGKQVSPDVKAAPSRMDRATFGRSGTRGREGLGATPAHPEGAGGVAD